MKMEGGEGTAGFLSDFKPQLSIISAFVLTLSILLFGHIEFCSSPLGRGEKFSFNSGHAALLFSGLLKRVADARS